MYRRPVVMLVVVLFGSVVPALAQSYGKPDRDAPGDEMIQEYLAREAERLDGRFLDGIKTRDDWEQGCRPQLESEYLYMLGLWPLPEKTPLKATVTGTLEGDGYVVEKLHFQSRPQLYVTGNLYRPADVPKRRAAAGGALRLRPLGRGPRRQQDRLPVARHLVRPPRLRLPRLDTLQLGEIAGDPPRHLPREPLVVALARLHAGRRRVLERHPRHRLPASAGPDVDPERIARHRHQRRRGGHVLDRRGRRARQGGRAGQRHGRPRVLRRATASINGHCDCMFLYNTFQWPWTHDRRADRPAAAAVRQQRQRRDLPDGRQRPDHQPPGAALQPLRRRRPVDAVVSIGGHAYREDIRQAAYRFINTHLKDDPRIVDRQRGRSGLGQRQGEAFSDRAGEAPRVPHRRGPAQG